MRSLPTRSSVQGFSLVELVVATTLSTIVLASVVSTFIVFAAGSKSVAGYTEMSGQSRKALELYSRDIRAAEDITQAEETTLLIVYPDGDFYDGSTVEYTYDDSASIFSRIERDKDGNLNSNEVVLDGVEQFAFGFFDPLGTRLDYDTESLLLSVKSVRIDAVMVRDISETDVTDYIISARFMMRNRSVTK